jgi:hypothetical protein
MKKPRKINKNSRKRAKDSQLFVIIFNFYQEYSRNHQRISKDSQKKSGRWRSKHLPDRSSVQELICNKLISR